MTRNEFIEARLKLFPGPNSRERMAEAMSRDWRTIYRWEEARSDGSCIPQVAVKWVERALKERA